MAHQMRFHLARARAFDFHMSRRAALAGGLSAGLAGLELAGLGFAGPAVAQSGEAPIPQTEIMDPGPLPDLWLGSKEAPCALVEYASLTCGHCATFHAKTLPDLKAKYIDTGKVRYTLREFPLDPLATAAFMLARYAGDDKRNAIVDAMFEKQNDWITNTPVDSLRAAAKQFGITSEQFDACLNDADLYGKVSQTRDRAMQKFGVDSTPTFFANGVRRKGSMSPEELDKFLAPFLAK